MEGHTSPLGTASSDGPTPALLEPGWPECALMIFT